MSEFVAPGVFVEELTFRSTPIEGVDTSTAGFVGPTAFESAQQPGVLDSLAAFERVHGSGSDLTFADGARLTDFMWHAARAFFENGGRRLYVARAHRKDGLRPEACDYSDALLQFDTARDIAIVAAPGASWVGPGTKVDRGAQVARLKTVIDHVEKMRHRFAVLDSPAGQSPADVRAFRDLVDSPRAALYYPWLRVAGATGDVLVPPSGAVAGIYARVDLERGVHRAPANQQLQGALGIERALSHDELDDLSQRGINCVRELPGRGVLVWGARTLARDADWKYVSVRRLIAFIERSIEEGTQWAAFEVNGDMLWAAVRRTVENFLLRIWQSGALPGATPEKAFFVRCDRTTMTQDDIDNGRLVCVVGVAPVRPAEFVVVRIGMWTADRKP